jgi:hypothetical protein
MQYTEMSATDAVNHFAKSETYKDLWKGTRNSTNKEYAWARKIVNDASKGQVSETRARLLIEQYGGQEYRVNTCFEVAVSDANGSTFKAALENIWAEKEGEEVETEL